jgi:hypothetical protein
VTHLAPGQLALYGRFLRPTARVKLACKAEEEISNNIISNPTEERKYTACSL